MQSHRKVIPLHGDRAAPATHRQNHQPIFCTEQEIEFLDLYRQLDEQGRLDMRLMFIICRNVSGKLEAREEG